MLAKKTAALVHPARHAANHANLSVWETAAD